MVHLLCRCAFGPISARCFGTERVQGGCNLHGGRRGESYLLLDKGKQLLLSKIFYWSETSQRQPKAQP